MSELPEPIAGLVREHRHVEELVHDARAAIDAATVRGAPEGVVARGIDAMQDLDAFLAIDLNVHIAKEEEVLFPAMRRLTEENDVIVVDMLAQHEEIRAGEDELQRILAALDATHDELHAEAANLARGLAGIAGGAPSMNVLTGLRDTVMRLDWILQGHFGDEEDALFESCPAWFTPRQFAAFAERMQEIEREWS